MECNFDACPAKIQLDHVNKRLDSGTNEFDEMRKENRELSKRVTEIATHQTKISADLLVHMNRSEDKHSQLVNLISTLGENLKSHTNDEMELQRKLVDKLDEVEKKLAKDEFKVGLLWTAGGLAVLGAVSVFWDMIKTKLGL